MNSQSDSNSTLLDGESSPGAPIKVAVVEDNDTVRTALTAIVRMAPDLSLCAAFPDAESAVEGLKKVVPDVVLMDAFLPGKSGIECTRWLHAEMPMTRVIMLSIEEDSRMVFHALEAGASGYLLKPTEPVRILDAIREVHLGGTPMAREVVRSLARVLRSRAECGSGAAASPIEPITSKSLGELLANWDQEVQSVCRGMGDRLLELFCKWGGGAGSKNGEGVENLGPVEEGDVAIADIGDVVRDLARILVPRKLAVVTIEVHGSPESFGMPVSLIRALFVPLIRSASRAIAAGGPNEWPGRIHLSALPVGSGKGVRVAVDDSGSPWELPAEEIEELLKAEPSKKERLPERLQLLRCARTVVDGFGGEVRVSDSRLGGARVEMALSFNGMLP